ncbi:hypothetical protein [Kineococcus sp. SYSU DK005]|uniref:hypothetical protein n=1 Tax=Kineococcus sp. SYSU DK005 TaxID=3383126 RepID=UPI003D7D5696
MNSSDAHRPLSALYQGDHWAQALSLPASARAAGFEATLWVASAGLGLQPVTTQAPAYAATFAARHADRVAADAVGRRQWWHALQEHRGAATLTDLARGGSLLLVLSEDYGHALHEELSAAAAVASDALLIGGALPVPGVQRLPADRRLRRHLGGTMTSLNVRTAGAWLRALPTPRLTSPAALKGWQEWAAQVAHEEVYDRRPLSDDQIRLFITTQRALGRHTSKTTMLRALRADGQACEQSRFGRLYAEVAQAQGSRFPAARPPAEGTSAPPTRARLAAPQPEARHPEHGGAA